MKLKQLLLSSLVLVSTSVWADPTYRLFVTNEKVIPSVLLIHALVN